MSFGPFSLSSWKGKVSPFPLFSTLACLHFILLCLLIRGDRFSNGIVQDDEHIVSPGLVDNFSQFWRCNSSKIYNEGRSIASQPRTYWIFCVGFALSLGHSRIFDILAYRNFSLRALSLKRKVNCIIFISVILFVFLSSLSVDGNLYDSCFRNTWQGQNTGLHSFSPSYYFALAFYELSYLIIIYISCGSSLKLLKPIIACATLVVFTLLFLFIATLIIRWTSVSILLTVISFICVILSAIMYRRLRAPVLEEFRVSRDPLRRFLLSNGFFHTPVLMFIVLLFRVLVCSNLLSGTVEACIWPLIMLLCHFRFMNLSFIDTYVLEAVESRMREKTREAQESKDNRESNRKFIRYLFHEIRVPLNAIMLGIEEVVLLVNEAIVNVPPSLPPIPHTILEPSQPPMEQLFLKDKSTPSDNSESKYEVEEVLTFQGEKIINFHTGAYKMLYDNINNQLKTIHETMDVISGNGVAMGKLLDDFLSMEKMDEGKYVLEPVPMKVTDLVRESVRMFVSGLAAKSINARIEIARNVPEFMIADVHKLRQVISNYVSNAVKFSPIGGFLRVRVSVLHAPPIMDIDPSLLATVHRLISEASEAGLVSFDASRTSQSLVPTVQSLSLLDPLAPEEEQGSARRQGTSSFWRYRRRSHSRVLPLNSSDVLARNADTDSGPGSSTSRPSSMARLVRNASYWLLRALCFVTGVPFSVPVGSGVPYLSGPAGTVAHTAGSTPAGFEYIVAAARRRTAALGAAAAAYALGSENSDPLNEDTQPIADLIPSIPYVHFCVVDSGVGISTTDQLRLFQPFNQINAGNLQNGSGSGLGLSICKRIVELSGGIVGVQSTLGAGSAFYFLVPLKTASIAVEALKEAGLGMISNGSMKADSMGGARSSETASGSSSSADSGMVSRSSSSRHLQFNYAPALADSAGSVLRRDYSTSPVLPVLQEPAASLQESTLFLDAAVTTDAVSDKPTALAHVSSQSVVSGDFADSSKLSVSLSPAAVPSLPNSEPSSHFADRTEISPNVEKESSTAGVVVIPNIGGHLVRRSTSGSPGDNSLFPGLNLAPIATTHHHQSDPPRRRRKRQEKTDQTDQQDDKRADDTDEGVDHRELDPRSGFVSEKAIERVSARLYAPRGGTGTKPGGASSNNLGTAAVGTGVGAGGGSTPPETTHTSTSTSSSQYTGTTMTSTSSFHSILPTPSPYGWMTPSASAISTPMYANLTQLRAAVVVDDVDSNRELFVRILRRRGVQHVAAANDGSTALQLADQLAENSESSEFSSRDFQLGGVASLQAVQVWFLDKEMPLMDGYDCARELRRKGITAPIVGVTGNGSESDISDFLAAGATEVIVKPLNVQALETVLYKLGLSLTAGSTPVAR